MSVTTLTYKNSSPAGDLISLLPSIRQIYRQTGKKAIIYQALNVPGQSLPDKPQPFQNEAGESIMMAELTFKMLSPLIKYQEYIEDFLVYEGQTVDYDFDKMRLETFTNQPMGSLNRWPFYVFPEMACDLSEKYIEVPEGTMNGKIIINFTSRYRNNWINYFFLKQYEEHILFCGLDNEYQTFCKQWKLNIEHYQPKDFLELASSMNECKFFLGNASMMFQIAEGLKIPRILETFHPMPNVIPMGANGVDFYHQQAAELYVHKFFSK